MFTGIVATTGTVCEKSLREGDGRLRIGCADLGLDRSETGDSVSVSGVCLTMLEPDASGFVVDVSAETLALTTLGRLGEGDRVNLELALRAQDRLGGHLVTGHVDGKGRLLSRREEGRSERLDFELPPELSRYVARKGSICIDGVSLTVNEAEGSRFGICVIPHTLAVTTLGLLRPEDEVNVEVDLLARYLERLLAAGAGGSGQTR